MYARLKEPSDKHYGTPVDYLICHFSHRDDVSLICVLCDVKYGFVTYKIMNQITILMTQLVKMKTGYMYKMRLKNRSGCLRCCSFLGIPYRS